VWVYECLTHTHSHSITQIHRGASTDEWALRERENSLNKTQLRPRRSCCWFINSNLKHRTHIQPSNQWVTHTLKPFILHLRTKNKNKGEKTHCIDVQIKQIVQNKYRKREQRKEKQKQKVNKIIVAILSDEAKCIIFINNNSHMSTIKHQIKYKFT